MIVCASGYFNPLHVGHLEYLRCAKELGDMLWVIVNNDYQVSLKGSTPVMCESDRLEIVKSIRWVDRAILSIDDDLSVNQTLEIIKPDVCANGGDTSPKCFREKEIYERLGIKMVFNVGGKKIQSSSGLIKNMLTMYNKCDMRYIGA